MSANVTDVVALLGVINMEESLRYYVDGLRFTMTNKWVVNGKVRWCWLTLGGAALMLQEHGKKGKDERASGVNAGVGVSLYFQCEDAVAVYHALGARGIAASEPQVGNGMWETMLLDPDGYKLHFTSVTDTPEETLLSEVKASSPDQF
jgi:lactoylglutathione lyase